jgi:hypothetical protein
MAAEAASKKAEREALRGVIQQWNANRLDLFELSEPNEVSTSTSVYESFSVIFYHTSHYPRDPIHPTTVATMTTTRFGRDTYNISRTCASFRTRV